jgi:hypothetical protein
MLLLPPAFLYRSSWHLVNKVIAIIQSRLLDQIRGLRVRFMSTSSFFLQFDDIRVLAKATESANAVDDSGPVCDGASLEIWYPGYADLGWNGEFSFLYYSFKSRLCLPTRP